jgi:hypothetical protein
LMEMEEGQAEGNEPHQMRDLSWMALYLRIAALEQSQAALLQRIAALEPVPPTLDSESLGQKFKVTFSPWRVLNSVLVLGAGAYKAVATLEGDTAGPTAVDWTVGVLWSLMYVCVSPRRAMLTRSTMKCVLGVFLGRFNVWPIKLVLQLRPVSSSVHCA